MPPTTQPYRNQHLELRRLAAAIPLDASGIDARDASRALACFKSVLVVHLKLQDGMLYPWMKKQASSELRDKAARFRDTMRTLLVAFVAFYQRWANERAIAADPDGFISAWRLVIGVVKHRLDAEANELYRSIDGYAEASAASSMAS